MLLPKIRAGKSDTPMRAQREGVDPINQVMVAGMQDLRPADSRY